MAKFTFKTDVAKNLQDSYDIQRKRWEDEQKKESASIQAPTSDSSVTGLLDKATGSQNKSVPSGILAMQSVLSSSSQPYQQKKSEEIAFGALSPGFSSGIGRGGGFGAGGGGFDADTPIKQKSEFAEYEDRMKSDNPLVNAIDAITDIPTVKNAVLSGMAQANKAVASTANLIPSLVADVAGTENKFPTQKLADYTSRVSDQFSEETQKAASRYGKGGKIAANLISGTTAAVPSAVLSMLSGGAPAIAQLAPQASGIASTLYSGISAAAKNPQFWTSFLNTVGNEYQDAVDGGAEPVQALLASVGASLVNSGIEVGGGIEALPEQLRSGDTNRWLAVLKSGLEEAVEEPTQNIVSGAFQKAAFDQDRKAFSTTDETAVINPAREAESSAMAFGSGLLLGAGQNVATSAADGRRAAFTPTTQQQDAEISDAARSVLEAAGIKDAEMPVAHKAPESEVVTIDQVFKKSKSKRISTENLNDIAESLGMDGAVSAVMDAMNRGEVGMDATGSIYRTSPESHIDNRDASTVGKRSMNAFQFDNPQLHDYYVQAAQLMLDDLGSTQRGERFYQPGSRENDLFMEGKWTGTKRNTSPEIAKALDDYKLSYNDIEKALYAIINDKGQENYAAAKKVELILDQILTDGHTSLLNGVYTPPNGEYLQAKSEISGGTPVSTENTFESFANNPLNDMMLESGEITEDELRNIWQQQNAETESVGAAPAGFEGDKVRGFSENLASDQARNAMIREDYQLAPEMYKTLSNKETLGKAQEIYAKGIDSARAEIEAAIGRAQAGQKLSPEMVPLAKMVADELAVSGDLTSARRILDSIAVELTASGQLSQAAKILREAGPATRISMLDKSIDQINKWGRERYGDKWTDFELTAEESAQAAAIQNGDEQAFMDLYQQVAKRIGKEMPSTWWEKMTEVRRLAMLANPVTQVRNVVGNIPMTIENRAANRLSGLIQSGMVKAGLLDASEQTRTATVSKTSKDLGRQLFDEKGEEIMASADKWDMNSMMRQYRKYFGDSTPGKALDAIRDFTYTMMEKGDQPFFRNAFIDSAAQIMEARGIQSYDDITQEVIDFATKNAMEATFKDSTVVASALNKIKRKGGVGGAALDVIIPFTTTPINITRQSFKYSPAGFIDAVYKGFQGDTTGMADALAKALTGSAGWAIAAILTKMGVITGAADDDPDKRNFDIMVGDKSFSFGGKVSYDWAQPFAAQLAAGAAIYEAIRGNESLTDAVLEAAKDAGDVVLDMSVLSNVQDLFSGYGSPSGAIADTLFSGAFSQMTPSILGQAARAVDSTVRSSVTGGNALEDAIAGVMAKVPGLSQKLPASVDQWGRDKMRVQNPLGRVLDEFLNPANLNTGSETEVDTELLRLSDAMEELKKTDETAPGKNTVFPSVAPYDIDGVELSGEERAQYQRTMGQAAYGFVSDLIQSEAYQNASDKDKAKQVARAYSLANAMAMKEYDESYDGGDLEKALTAIESGVDPAAWFAADAELRLTGGESTSQADYTEALESVDGLTDDQKASMWSAQSSSWKEEKNPYTGTLSQTGLTPMEIVEIINAHDVAADMENLSAREQAAEFSKSLDEMELTEDQYKAAMETYGFYSGFMADPAPYDYKTMNTTQKENFDDWGKDFGFTESAFIDAYNAASAAKDTQEYKDASDYTKDRLMKEALMDSGFSSEEASRFVRKFKW